MKPSPNALSALPTWIRRIAAPIALVTFTSLDVGLKTSKLKFEAKHYTEKDFNAKQAHAILGPWATPTASANRARTRAG